MTQKTGAMLSICQDAGCVRRDVQGSGVVVKVCEPGGTKPLAKL